MAHCLFSNWEMVAVMSAMLSGHSADSEQPTGAGVNVGGGASSVAVHTQLPCGQKSTV